MKGFLSFCCFAAAVAFCFFSRVDVRAQDFEGRPVRTIEDYSQVIPPFSHTLPPAHNSLITPEALESPLTQRYIAQYSTPGRTAFLNSTLDRGNIYMPFIREEIELRGLPPELLYLPIVESDYVITARSGSGAAGLWQFMMNSIAPWNMRVTELIDERRDFIKSTRGALGKLKENYDVLGSWEMALAAYNSGLGAITRTIQSTRENDYWALSARNELRQETLHFVPRLVAISYIMSQPRRFGIDIWREKFEWAAIPLPRQVSIDILADEAGISRELMRRLNGELLYGISPVDSNYLLKVPAEHLEAITELLQREDIQLIRYYYHVVRQGDTLWSMSRHYGTTLNMIEQLNPGISSRYLRIGETVIIPAYNDNISPMPAVVVQSAPVSASEIENFNGTHVVQRGETLWSISRMYGTTPEAIAAANDMQVNQILNEGRALKVPIIE